MIISNVLNFLPVSVARKFVTSHHPVHKSGISNHVDRIPNLWLDVSILIRHDAGTGIQRVVRAVWKELQKYCPEFRVCPVYATRKKRYCYAIRGEVCRDDPVVEVHEGDVFLGLDWAADILSANRNQVYSWKKKGCRVFVVVYDFLPVLHPEWFSDATVRKYKRWIKTVGIYADGLLCISHVVKRDAEEWFDTQFNIKKNLVEFQVFPLGADFSNAKHSVGTTEIEDSWIQKLKNSSYLIQVGTMEPRKGHESVIDIADYLWSRGSKFKIVFAGRAGWKTEKLQQRIKSHPLYCVDLFWFENASDETLESLYANSSGVLVASQGEGFGLPLIEASMYQKKVLARDIPVFREIAGSNVSFFTTGSIESMAEDFLVWFRMLDESEFPFVSRSEKPFTWELAAASIRAALVM